VELKPTKVVKQTENSYRAKDDEELARLVNNGDHAALEALYDRYSRQSIGLAYRIIGQMELAEEVAQEAFLRFWERPDLYQPGRSRFAGWLLSVVHHRAVNEVRRSAFRLNVSAHHVFAENGEENEQHALLNRLSDGGPDPHELVWLETQREAIREALQQLPDPQRQVIELAYFRGLKQDEIASHLDEPLGTVKSRTRQALQRLRVILQSRGLHASSEISVRPESV
jgi:RNA polymerase sigma-70 factor (ECF subfamily)